MWHQHARRHSSTQHKWEPELMATPVIWQHGQKQWQRERLIHDNTTMQLPTKHQHTAACARWSWRVGDS